MKLKRLPEDFRVEELPVVRGGDRGRFAFYRLWKRGLGTPEAIEGIRRRWNLSGAQIHYGGLKDRHAETIQYLTILDGPDRPLRETNLELEPLGRLPHPYGPPYFRGNRFELTLRDLGKDASARALAAIAALPRDGLPNYFDDQRFGSVGFDGGFVAEAWLKGDHERALRLAIAGLNAADRPDAREEKQILNTHWGDWAAAKDALPRSHSRSLVTYLVDHPDDFRGAFARVRRDLRSLYFSAFQSFLWNLMLGGLIDRTTRPDQRSPVEFKVATLPLHHDLDAVQAAILRATPVPLPASRTPLEPEGPMRELANHVLGARGLVWEELRVKHLKDVFFSKGSRESLFFPANLTHSLARDDLYPGRQKLLMGFDLPKGAYATLVVKRVTGLKIDEEPPGAGEPS